MREALWGLAASAALYVAGSLLWVWLVRRWWAEQPDDLDSDLRGLRDQAREWNPRSLFRPPARRSLIWLALGAGFFAVLWAAEFGLLFQVLYVTALSAWWTFLSIDPLRVASRSSVLGLYVFGFMIAAGTLGAVCFLGAVIAEGFA